MSIVAVSLATVFFAVSIIWEEFVPFTLLFAQILIVAAIVMALPEVLTFSLVVGVVPLEKKEAMVSRLSAIGEMAGMKLLWSDKTVTITKTP